MLGTKRNILSLTPGCSPVRVPSQEKPFQRIFRIDQTVETVRKISVGFFTGLKPGVNEKQGLKSSLPSPPNTAAAIRCGRFSQAGWSRAIPQTTIRAAIATRERVQA